MINAIPQPGRALLLPADHTPIMIEIPQTKWKEWVRCLRICPYCSQAMSRWF
jgi:hypothetical protein